MEIKEMESLREVINKKDDLDEQIEEKALAL